MVRKFSGGAIHDRTHDNQKSHRKRTRARNRGGSNPTEGQTEKTSQKTETTKTSTENHFYLRLTTFHHLLFLFWINARKLRRKNTCSTHEICISHINLLKWLLVVYNFVHCHLFLCNVLINNLHKQYMYIYILRFCKEVDDYWCIELSFPIATFSASCKT